MAIAFRNATTTAVSTASTAGLTNNVPTGTVNGDLLVWMVADNSTTIPATPTGWTLLQSLVAVNTQATVWYRIAASEPASYTTGALASAPHVGIMAAFSGVDNVNPFDVTTPTFVAGTTATSPPAVTPVTIGAWVLGIGAARVNTGITNTTYSSSNLAAVDAQVTTASASLANTVGAFGHFAWSSGAFTPAFTASNATLHTIGGTVALRPVERKAIDIHNRRAIVRPTIF